MVVIGELHNVRMCQAFSDYLLLQKIQHQVVASDDNQRLQIFVNENDESIAKQLFDEFAANPAQDKYFQASWQTGAIVSQKGTSLGLNSIWQSGGTLTKFVTLICLAIFAASAFGYFREIFHALSFKWTISEFYRVLTPAFMHLSVLHLIFNLCWWWYLGSKVESSLGSTQLLQILLFTALISNVAQAAIVSNNFAGLSGVTYGLAGFVWFFGKRTNSDTLFLPNNIFVFLLLWMGLGFIELLPINMANWAHLAGLVSGIVIAHFATTKQKTD